MSSVGELRALCGQLLTFVGEDKYKSTIDYIEKLKETTQQVENAFSGSWLGYHSRVYYEKFSTPPAGAHFRQEWCLRGDSFLGHTSHGDWVEYQVSDVENHIFKKVSDTSKDAFKDMCDNTASIEKDFETIASDAISILQSEQTPNDNFLESILDTVNGLKVTDEIKIINNWSPSGQTITRDRTAVG